MSIPKFRYIGLEGDNATFQCLSCYARFYFDFYAHNLNYCPNCGIEISSLACRPHAMPKWQYTRDVAIPELRRPKKFWAIDEAVITPDNVKVYDWCRVANLHGLSAKDALKHLRRLQATARSYNYSELIYRIRRVSQ